MYHATRACLLFIIRQSAESVLYSTISSRVLVGFIHRRCRRKEAEANASRYEIPDWYTVPKDLQYLREKNLCTVPKDLQYLRGKKSLYSSERSTVSAGKKSIYSSERSICGQCCSSPPSADILKFH